jgi:hypothetical protein
MLSTWLTRQLVNSSTFNAFNYSKRSTMLQYLFKLTISLSIVYLFYQLFLRRLTFYNWNRWYLLIYSLVCFVIPFINVFTIIVEQPALRKSAFVNYIPAITQMTPNNAAPSVGINWWLVTAVVFLIGILVMIVRLGMQYYSLYKMRSKAVLLYDNKVKLYHIDAPVMPFSFGRGIYVNQHQHSEHELKDIIRHEFIHVKQRHSLDIIWSELLCILNWYNPFAWLLRHDIRQNLEFIADQQVLQTGLDRKQYQYLLLKVIGVNSFSIANNFNFSSLKKRIAMMNKAQSARVHLIRFLFLLPLLVVVLLAFRNSTQTHRQPLRALVTDTVPAAEKIPPGWKDMESINVNNNNVIVRLKNKKVEKYDLSNAKEREAFEQKYGQLPAPPPPPLAPVGIDRDLPEAPEAPEKPELREIPERPEAPEAPEAPESSEAARKLLADLEAPQVVAVAPVPPPPPPPAPAQDCYNQKGFCITVVDNRGEAIVIVKDKDNKIVLAVSLTDWKKDKQYEDKYGEVPPRQIILLPKTVIGVKVKSQPAVKVDAVPAVDPKPAAVFKAEQVDEVVVVGKPAKVAFSKDVTVSADRVILTKVSPNDVIIIGRKANPDAETGAKAKEAAEAKAKAEGDARKAEGVKLAAPTKEQ